MTTKIKQKTKQARKKKIIILSIGILFFVLLTLFLTWTASGNAFCKWYDFVANDSITRQIMESCIK